MLAVSEFMSQENGSHAMKYADAGVNIAVADEAKQRIRHLATRTFTNGVLGGIGGFVERKKLLTGKSVKPGDTLLALPSAGLHTNGYSLARKLVFEVAKLKPETYVAEVGNKIGPELLKPHLCYAPALKNILAKGWLSALAHITGGGIPGNLPRVLPAGVKAEIDLASWPVPAMFQYLATLGRIDTGELLK